MQLPAICPLSARRHEQRVEVRRPTFHPSYPLSNQSAHVRPATGNHLWSASVAPILLATYASGLQIVYLSLPTAGLQGEGPGAVPPVSLGELTLALTAIGVREDAARAPHVVLVGGGAHLLSHHWAELPACLKRMPGRDGDAGARHKLRHADVPGASPGCEAAFKQVARATLEPLLASIRRPSSSPRQPNDASHRPVADACARDAEAARRPSLTMLPAMPSHFATRSGEFHSHSQIGHSVDWAVAECAQHTGRAEDASPAGAEYNPGWRDDVLRDLVDEIAGSATDADNSLGFVDWRPMFVDLWHWHLSKRQRYSTLRPWALTRSEKATRECALCRRAILLSPYLTRHGCLLAASPAMRPAHIASLNHAQPHRAHGPPLGRLCQLPALLHARRRVGRADVSHSRGRR